MKKKNMLTKALLFIELLINFSFTKLFYNNQHKKTTTLMIIVVIATDSGYNCCICVGNRFYKLRVCYFNKS